MGRLNIAVIGAGLSGLCAAKYAKQSGHLVTVFEQSNQAGGTWVYSDLIGKDEYGLSIHSSMYKNLRTNLPKHVMEFQDFLMPELPRSYITSEQFLSYLQSYADHFQLNELIKFKHHVLRVHPTEGTKWEVTVNDLNRSTEGSHIFDNIFVANGHNSVPSIPEFEGASEFQGRVLHSHEYRKPEIFKDKTVLIIGAGPSGVDLTYFIAQAAKSVIFSHHSHNFSHIYPENVIRKGSVKKFTQNGVVFADGSTDEITDVVYCTGYKFTLPFATKECGLAIDDNYVIPLYKHCINAVHPTMALIGYVFTSANTQMIDMQVRFAMQHWNGKATFPSQEEMIADSDKELAKRMARGFPKKKGHYLGVEFQREYCEDLSTTANIEKVPEIVLNIYDDCIECRSKNPKDYRNNNYKVIDDKHFERTTIAS